MLTELTGQPLVARVVALIRVMLTAGTTYRAAVPGGVVMSEAISGQSAGVVPAPRVIPAWPGGVWDHTRGSVTAREYGPLPEEFFVCCEPLSGRLRRRWLRGRPRRYVRGFARSFVRTNGGYAIRRRFGFRWGCARAGKTSPGKVLLCEQVFKAKNSAWETFGRRFRRGRRTAASGPAASGPAASDIHHFGKIFSALRQGQLLLERADQDAALANESRRPLVSDAFAFPNENLAKRKKDLQPKVASPCLVSTSVSADERT